MSHHACAQKSFHRISDLTVHTGFFNQLTVRCMNISNISAPYRYRSIPISLPYLYQIGRDIVDCVILYFHLSRDHSPVLCHKMIFSQCMTVPLICLFGICYEYFLRNAVFFYIDDSRGQIRQCQGIFHIHGRFSVQSNLQLHT